MLRGRTKTFYNFAMDPRLHLMLKSEAAKRWIPVRLLITRAIVDYIDRENARDKVISEEEQRGRDEALKDTASAVSADKVIEALNDYICTENIEDELGY